MDLKRIFMKNASPTKVGGMAILEGLMMRGSRAVAVAIREPNGNIHLTIEPVKDGEMWMKLPVIRGVVSFIQALVSGTEILFYSADIIEKFEKATPEKKDKFTLLLEKHLGEKKTSQMMIYLSVIFSVIFVVGVFIILPTFLASLLKRTGIQSVLILNLCEGLLRIAMFIIYVLLAAKMPEIRSTFEYHGAEHKTIHCYENGLELTPKNAQGFYTLHPRCGTSFMMFVMIISLLLFSLFGWPNLAARIGFRLLLIPVIAGVSYEVLQWTGRHDNAFVRALSLPGIMLQTITTREPSSEELEVAIAAMKAVLPSHEDPSVKVDYWVGEMTPEGKFIKNEEETSAYIKSKKKGKS